MRREEGRKEDGRERKEKNKGGKEEEDVGRKNQLLH